MGGLPERMDAACAASCPMRPATTAASVEEEDALYARWLPLLARDPAYNPGFSLQAEGRPCAGRPAAGLVCCRVRPLPTVLAHPADLFGCGHYRVIQRFSTLRESTIDGALSIIDARGRSGARPGRTGAAERQAGRGAA